MNKKKLIISLLIILIVFVLFPFLLHRNKMEIPFDSSEISKIIAKFMLPIK